MKERQDSWLKDIFFRSHFQNVSIKGDTNVYNYTNPNPNPKTSKPTAVFCTQWSSGFSPEKQSSNNLLSLLFPPISTTYIKAARIETKIQHATLHYWLRLTFFATGYAANMRVDISNFHFLAFHLIYSSTMMFKQCLFYTEHQTDTAVSSSSSWSISFRNVMASAVASLQFFITKQRRASTLIQCNAFCLLHQECGCEKMLRHQAFASRSQNKQNLLGMSFSVINFAGAQQTSNYFPSEYHYMIYYQAICIAFAF